MLLFGEQPEDVDLPLELCIELLYFPDVIGEGSLACLEQLGWFLGVI
jgi:hypothetical protein